MWQPSPRVSTSIRMSRNERLAPRERSLEGTRLVYVSSVPLSQLWVEDIDPGQWILIMFWAAGDSSVGDFPLPPRTAPGTPPSPPLPPPGHHPLRAPPQQLRTPSRQGSDRFSADDHSAQTVPQSSVEQLSADDASLIPSSRKSSQHSRGERTHFLLMMILFRTKHVQAAREIQVMPKFHIWDQTSGINPITSIQMMKSSNMIDHLPLAVSYHALTEDQLSSIRTKLIPNRNLRHCTEKEKRNKSLFIRINSRGMGTFTTSAYL